MTEITDIPAPEMEPTDHAKEAHEQQVNYWRGLITSLDFQIANAEPLEAAGLEGQKAYAQRQLDELG